MWRLKRAVTLGIAQACAIGRGASVKHGFRTLLYHSVGKEIPQDPYGISLEPRSFESQMRTLAESDWLTVADFNEPLLADDGLRVAVTFDDGFKDNLYQAAPVMLKYRIPFTVFVTSSFIRSGKAEYLNASELRELASLAGASIGSHGMTHTRLGQADDTTLWEELHDSRREIEDIIGKEVTAVSYPHGSVDVRVRDAARRAGYLRGGSSRFGINDEKSDPLWLSRCEIVARDTSRVFLQKLRGAWDWYGRRERLSKGLWPPGSMRTSK